MTGRDEMLKTMAPVKRARSNRANIEATGTSRRLKRAVGRDRRRGFCGGRRPEGKCSFTNAVDHVLSGSRHTGANLFGDCSDTVSNCQRRG